MKKLTFRTLLNAARILKAARCTYTERQLYLRGLLQGADHYTLRKTRRT